MNIQGLSAVLPAPVFAELPMVSQKFEVNTVLRLSHFLAQASHESANFSILKENLNYDNKGLLKIFPKYFTPETALQYHRKPEMIANRVYANRMGNGDEKSGDGWKHRGMGAIQLTGKLNQQAFFISIGLDPNSDPKLIAEKYPLLSAAWFWSVRKLNAIADQGAGTEIITKATKVVNGGLHGIDDRIAKFGKFYSILNIETT